MSQGVKRAREGGVEALDHHPAPGAQRKQLAELPTLWKRGAEAFGVRGNVRTYPRMAAVIKRNFGVKYPENHMPRMLKKIGWSRQKPRRRATQRDEAALEQWREEDWPTIMQEAEEAGQTVFLPMKRAFACYPALSIPMRRGIRRRCWTCPWAVILAR